MGCVMVWEIELRYVLSMLVSLVLGTMAFMYIGIAGSYTSLWKSSSRCLRRRSATLLQPSSLLRLMTGVRCIAPVINRAALF